MAETPTTRSSSGSVQPAEIETAQRAWCAALLGISKASRDGADATQLARQALSSAYDYDRGTVLFKPTLTYGEQTFRMTKRGALAYFVGGDAEYPNDSGFARKPWVSCEAKIAGTVPLASDAAVAMGNVTFTSSDGTQVTVDKTFGYRRGPGGELRIVLHHSSLPYAPPSAATSTTQR